MAEPDQTNADAERVSDIVAYRELAERCLEHMGKADFQTVLNDCHAAARALRAAADIIEAQSKALAEAREALIAWTKADEAREAADELTERAYSEGWDNDPTGSMHLISASSRATVAMRNALDLRSKTLTPTPENPNG